MSDDIVRYEVRDEIAYIVMNRPDKLNAVSVPLSDALNQTWTRFEADPEAKVAILSSTGRAFCAGADLSGGAPADDVGIPWAIRLHRAYPQNGVTVFKPIVGAVHGYALGAGWALAVRGCDITIAGESAMFGFPEPRVGISIPPVDYLPYVPFKASLEFMLLAWNGGEMLDARRAYELGMVNRVVPDADLMSEAIRWAEKLKKIPPMYIKAVKYGHYKAVESKTTRDEREYLNFIWPQEVSDDSREGRRAFKEKREPRFKGR
ncbi:MAG TPA: enoyl-CoA hydratase/isomerase family protein [Candidatus Binataceae bacterium]|nr:enoyl-CoA hydratase/isomerase family protein [Candidatus Binataceae bacterium]